MPAALQRELLMPQNVQVLHVLVSSASTFEPNGQLRNQTHMAGYRWGVSCRCWTT